MIVAVASFKGGVGKTTTAVHLAAYLAGSAPTLLLDGDPNRSASSWSRRGALPFQVEEAPPAGGAPDRYTHVVIDTQARPSRESLAALARQADLLVVPTTPDALALDALMQTVGVLRSLGAGRYRILLTMIPPRPSRDGEEARSALAAERLPLFAVGIRRLAAFQRAALRGVPVYRIAGERARQGWEEYRAVGREIAE